MRFGAGEPSQRRSPHRPTPRDPAASTMTDDRQPVPAAGRADQEQAMAPTDRSHPFPTGTWTIDPVASIITVASRTPRLWTTTGRLHGFGVIRLEELPPVGVIRFQQPSGLPVLTIVLDPPGTERKAPNLDALGGGPDVAGLRRTLRSESLEILPSGPSGTWRIMATLTARDSSGLVELLLEVDPAASRQDLLVLTGRGVLDRRALGTGKRALLVGPRLQLQLALQATRAAGDATTGQLTEDGRPAHTRLATARRSALDGLATG
jgi:hypothetical protein